MQLQEAYKVVAVRTNGTKTPFKYDSSPIIEGEEYIAKHPDYGINSFIKKSDADNLCLLLNKGNYNESFNRMYKSSSSIEYFIVVKIVPIDIKYIGYTGTTLNEILSRTLDKFNAIECRSIMIPIEHDSIPTSVSETLIQKELEPIKQ